MRFRGEALAIKHKIEELMTEGEGEEACLGDGNSWVTGGERAEDDESIGERIAKGDERHGQERGCLRDGSCLEPFFPSGLALGFMHTLGSALQGTYPMSSRDFWKKSYQALAADLVP